MKFMFLISNCVLQYKGKPVNYQAFKHFGKHRFNGNGTTILYTRSDVRFENGNCKILTLNVGKYSFSSSIFNKVKRWGTKTELQYFTTAGGKQSGSSSNAAWLASCWPMHDEILLRASVLDQCIGALADCVLCQLPRQQETNCSLFLSRGDCRPLVVVNQAESFSGNVLEDFIDEAVHVGHYLGGNVSIGMHLLQHPCRSRLSSSPSLFVVSFNLWGSCGEAI